MGDSDVAHFFCFCLLFIYDERRDILNKNEEEEDGHI